MKGKKKCHLIYRPGDVVPYCKIHKVSMVLMCPLNEEGGDKNVNFTIRSTNRRTKRNNANF